MGKAPRDAFGEFLEDIGEDNRIVVLTADLASSTRTSVFQKKYPERFINVGVAEQNLMGIAAGLASCGFIPIVSTFAIFASGRAWEQVRQSIVYGGFNVKIIATHGGITVGEDGATHQAIEDIAVMRAIPGSTVLVPADAVETYHLLRKVLEYEGMVYMRLPRGKTEIVYQQSPPKTDVGKSEILKEGKDITLAGCGVMVPYIVKASKLLERDGVSVEILNVSSIKPLDKETLLKSAKKTNLIITAEDHNIYGGMGSAVSEFLSEEFPVVVKRMGIKDEFGVSGKPDELLKFYALSVEDIYRTAKETLSKKRNL